MRKTNGIKKLALTFLTTVSVIMGTLPNSMVSYADEADDSFIFHSTSQTEITKDMLQNTPPKDYKVNQDIQKDAKDAEYGKYFLKDDVQTVSIKIDENNMNYMLQNAYAKPSVMTDSVTIGDTTVGYAGLRTKGSYTLEHAYTDNYGNDRFSFSINFGKYIKKSKYGVKQNFYGCHKISFNNFYFDKTMLKEYAALTLMTQMGIPTPEYGLAKLYINDEYYGVYFMVESLDKSILERYYNTDRKKISDYLAKPENTTLLYDDAMNQYINSKGDFDLSPVLKKSKDGTYEAIDELEDQSPLWEEDKDMLQNVVKTLPTVLKWQKQISALSNGTDFDGKKIDVNSDKYLELLNQVMDTDEVTKYFAVHSFLVQIDDMFDGQKNYGLYVDDNGKCMVIPWDYDLSFGCFYPGTAEFTANYDIDVMYKLYQNGYSDDIREEMENVYKQYPLFHVIFQNKKLMEKYHGYMKECAKVAVLGGTVLKDKTYNPGYLNSLIEKITPALKKAASEQLASHVHYMNHINQPANMMAGIPNLSKIIAMRSIGVLAQVDGMDTYASTFGCNLETLGNAMPGEDSNSYVLTAIDAKTGIYATADYGENEWGVKPPSIQTKLLTAKDTIYLNTKKELRCGEDNLTVYHITNTATPKGDYTLSIPVAPDYMEKGISIYACDEKGNMKELKADKQDNVYTVTTDSVKYIAVAQNISQMEKLLRTPAFYVVCGAVLCIIILCVIVLKIKKKKATDNTVAEKGKKNE